MADQASDVLVVGAGAAGMMASLAARGGVDRSGARRLPAPDAPRVTAIDTSQRLGLKILVSGGGRCNVANARVTAADFDCDAPHVLRGLLRQFPPSSARAFFESRGVPLQEEPMGKLFPRSQNAREIVAALLRSLEDAGVRVETGADVVDLAPSRDRWIATCADGRVFAAPRVVLATGGRSLPKTGSRGFGFDAARSLGHSTAPELPALTPLLLDAGSALAGLAGITHPTVLTLAPRGVTADQLAGARFRPFARSAGSFLFTHRGASGPAALDVSGACALALHERREVELVADFWALARPLGEHRETFAAAKAPGACLASDLAPRPVTLEQFRSDVESLAGGRRSGVGALLAGTMPRALADALLRDAGIDPARPALELGAAAWRAVHAAVARRDLRLLGVEGYAKAEVTRGGVLLAELNRTSLASRLRDGLFLCGEVLNCTGRLGGFNFQWAWSSGFAAGSGALYCPPSR